MSTSWRKVFCWLGSVDDQNVMEKITRVGQQPTSPTYTQNSTPLSFSPGPSHRTGRPDPKLEESPLWNSLHENSRPPDTENSTLERKLMIAQIECLKEEHRFFIPIDALHDIITPNAVREELIKIHPYLDESMAFEYAESICRNSRKVFAILVGFGKSKSICAFVRENIADKDLPLVRFYSEPHISTRRNGHPYTLRTKGSPEKAIEAMADWSDRDIRNFCREQWWVLAPVFDEMKHYELDDSCVLPFIEDHEGEHDQTKSGGYSQVWGVRIHPAHQRLYKSANPSIKEPLLAIKRPFSLERVDFTKETDMLNALAIKNHPHLVKLLATYKLKGRYHLVFPYANANLRGYWENTPTPPWNRDTVLWSLRQFKGLASGLNTIHNFRTNIPLGSEPDKLQPGGVLGVVKDEELYGRHGDIKPENILWSNEIPGVGVEGILQIADMGLGRFHHRDTRSRIDPRNVVGSPTYEPPECVLGKPVSREYDMWSLGCVFLEFITWLLEGNTKILGFAEERDAAGEDGVYDDKFFSVFEKEGSKDAVVREKVTQWIAGLRTHPRCSRAIDDLLTIVEDGLLVVDSTKRMKSERLYQRLISHVDRAEKDEQYLLASIPRAIGSSTLLAPTPASGPLSPSMAISSHSRGNPVGQETEVRQPDSDPSLQSLTPRPPTPLIKISLAPPSHDQQ